MYISVRLVCQQKEVGLRLVTKRPMGGERMPIRSQEGRVQMEQATDKGRQPVAISCQTCRILGTEFTIDIIGPAHHESGLRYAYLCSKSLEPWCPDGKGSSFFDLGLRYRISMISKDSVFL